MDYPAETGPMNECSPDPHGVDNSAKDFTGLTDIYWVCAFPLLLLLPVAPLNTLG